MPIITLIASHIDCKKRLHHFIKLLDGINKQIDYFDEIDVRISLSHNKEIERDEIRFLFNTFNKLNFKIYYHEDQLSQFEHYAYLVNTLEVVDTEATWILFSDDDDEWAENRLAAYHHMINYLAEKPDYEKTSAVRYTHEKNKNTMFGGYIDYCVKFKYVKIFFADASTAQLQHKFCDCYFVRFIHTHGAGTLKHAFCATDDILYNWIQHEDYDKQEKHATLEENLKTNLDLYMAQYANPTAIDWLKFCMLYFDGNYFEGMKTEGVPRELKKTMLKIYLDNYENHIFATHCTSSSTSPS